MAGANPWTRRLSAATGSPAGARGVSSATIAMSRAVTRSCLPSSPRVRPAFSRRHATALPRSSNWRAMAYSGSDAMFRSWNLSRSSFTGNRVDENTSFASAEQFPYPGAAFFAISFEMRAAKSRDCLLQTPPALDKYYQRTQRALPTVRTHSAFSKTLLAPFVGFAVVPVSKQPLRAQRHLDRRGTLRLAC